MDRPRPVVMVQKRVVVVVQNIRVLASLRLEKDVLHVMVSVRSVESGQKSGPKDPVREQIHGNPDPSRRVSVQNVVTGIVVVQRAIQSKERRVMLSRAMHRVPAPSRLSGMDFQPRDARWKNDQFPRARTSEYCQVSTGALSYSKYLKVS